MTFQAEGHLFSLYQKSTLQLSRVLLICVAVQD